ncbi:catabolite degradation [Favolaschia claudopus]|uniref:Catabolite degradation n=1 Tax=Favolaschia claudopus TaxID=2862362 RepID=A0AAW0BA96_9AGAR
MSVDGKDDAPGAFPSRRDAILNLVEMLLQHPGDPEDLNQDKQPSSEDDNDVSSVDEHRQTAGAATFHHFERRIIKLDKHLRNFANATRQLGSSVAIISSTFHLRERIAQLLFLYRENAADLFPQKIAHASQESMTDLQRKVTRRRHNTQQGYSTPPHPSRSAMDEDLDPEAFPGQFEALANSILTFGRCLNEFPEFTDEAINASIVSFQGDLRYWASCLQVHQGRFRIPTVQQYVHDLTVEMGEYLDSIASTVAIFVSNGAPTIKFGQKHKTNTLVGFSLNLSTIATFFSAVTATTLQSSFVLLETPTQHAVNGFWFSSLVFSIAAVVNNLVGLTWMQAIYRSPRHRLPWWVLIWIKRSPLVFLVLSIVCFSIGLCLFVYASGQHRVTSAIITISTVFTSFGLAAVSTWLLFERYVFLRHRGGKWLPDVLAAMPDEIRAIPSVQRTMDVLRKIRRRWRMAVKTIAQFASRVGSKIGLLYEDSSDSETGDDLGGNILPVSNSRPRDASISAMTGVIQLAGSSDLNLSTIAPRPPEPQIPVASTLTSPVSETGMANLNTPRRQRSSSSTTEFGERKRMLAEEHSKTVLTRSRTIATWRPKLQKLHPPVELEAHQALVCHLQFSPDGKYLASSSWDCTCIIWQIERRMLTCHRVLGHTEGFVGQVAWSNTGNMLLTKLVRGVKVWTQDGVCQKTIDRQTCVASIAWLPDSKSFLSVEGNLVTRLDLRGNILDQYNFGNINLHDVAVTPDNTRLLGVGTLLASPSGLHPSKSPAEKRLVVYNTELKQVEHQTPILTDVRNVALARDTRQGLVALVSHENKAPPQLWRMELLNDRENAALQVARLSLRHTYMPKRSVEFAGPSYFGGKNDELVLCAGEAGDIHIWDAESGMLLRYIPADQRAADLTCIAWNHAAEDPFMFATGSHDGAVRIWTHSVEQVDLNGDKPEGAEDITPIPMEDSASPVDKGHTEHQMTQTELEVLDMSQRKASSASTKSEASGSVGVADTHRTLTLE